ncbi:MAG: hypothetical protein F4039_05340 [Gammaproteobacteria bacterium]|nr:hypothetical protein [Gammaproteobacteria bacterium]MYF53420.1 hypothetical protein [Gammaproteobacteria bacterium]MYK43492.1 hypothetical protein [Gammaproteobacteria bacterium]
MVQIEGWKIVMKFRTLTVLAVVSMLLGTFLGSQEEEQAVLPMDSESIKDRLEAVKVRVAESQIKHWDENEDGEISKEEYVQMSTESAKAARLSAIPDTTVLSNRLENDTETEVAENSDGSEEETNEVVIDTESAKNEATRYYEKRFEQLDEDDSGSLSVDELLAELGIQAHLLDSDQDSMTEEVDRTSDGDEVPSPPATE